MLFGALAAVSVALTAGAQDMQTVYPTLSDDRLVNPHMGFLYYGAHQVPDMSDVIFVTLVWGEVEPQEGQFNWDPPKLRDARAAAEKMGKRVALRILPSFQAEKYSTPKWVIDLGVGHYEHTFPRDDLAGFQPLYEPEWWNPIYIEKYCNFVKASGEHFDGAPWLDYVDIRCYGFWGEGHRHGAKVPWPEDISKRNTIIRFIDAHLDAFEETPLVVQMASDAGTPYPEGTAIDYALEHGSWMRRDGFGPYISEQEAAAMQAHWRDSLVIAENGGALWEFATGKISRHWEKGAKPISLDGLYGQMLELHCNYIPLGWGHRDWEVLRFRPDLLKKLWMNMGYRLVVREASFPTAVSPGETFTVKTTWENLGVGRLPKAYPLAFYMANVAGQFIEVHVDEDFDQTKWFSGSSHAYSHSVTLPADAPAGPAFLAVALIEPESRNPTIALGMEATDQERRAIVGGLEVR